MAGEALTLYVTVYKRSGGVAAAGASGEGTARRIAGDSAPAGGRATAGQERGRLQARASLARALRALA